MNTETQTPRTDKNEEWSELHGKDVVGSDFARQLETELAAVTEQRDRLAEALQKLNEYDLGDIPVGVVRRCEEALQSLNPDHTVKANDMTAAVKGGSHES